MGLDVSMTDVHIVNVGQRPEHLVGVNFPQGVGKIVVSFVVESEDFVESVWKVIHHEVEKNFFAFVFLREKIVVNFNAIGMV